MDVKSWFWRTTLQQEIDYIEEREFEAQQLYSEGIKLTNQVRNSRI